MCAFVMEPPLYLDTDEHDATLTVGKACDGSRELTVIEIALELHRQALPRGEQGLCVHPP